MDFRLGPESDRLRSDVRVFLREAITPELEERLYRSGVSHDAEFNHRLHQKGWLAPGWPKEWGGMGASALESLPIAEEMTRAHAPLIGQGTTNLVARALLRDGDPEVAADIVPSALRGELLIALGYSEPEAGSDVAAAQTRAVRDGDGWVINGQKMFTTNGHIADFLFLLARTDPHQPKHRGLTMFLVPTDRGGFEAQAVHTLSGERTNICYLHDVRVEDQFRIGGVDQGWKVITGSLQDEHSSGYGAHIDRLIEDMEEWAATPNEDGTRPLDRDDVRVRLARAVAGYEVAMLLQRRAAWMSEQGQPPAAEGPMAKLVSTELLVGHAENLWDLLGADGLRSHFDPTAPQNGRVEHAMRHSLGTTIYAGTSEIQRNIIAQRGLGLPR